MMIGMMTCSPSTRPRHVDQADATTIAGRVNATQRGRIAMDTITRQLRSQVCYSATVPALVSGTDDRREVPRRPQRRLEADRAARDRLQPDRADADREASGPARASPLTFPTQTVTRQITDGVVAAAGARTSPADLPLLRVQHRDAAAARRVRCCRRPLSATDLARVAKIEIGFITLPPGTKTDLPGAPRRSRTKSTSASRIPTTQHPLPHAPDPPHPQPLPLPPSTASP